MVVDFTDICTRWSMQYTFCTRSFQSVEWISLIKADELPAVVRIRFFGATRTYPPVGAGDTPSRQRQTTAS
jgi:hypothetical protein